MLAALRNCSHSSFDSNADVTSLSDYSSGKLGRRADSKIPIEEVLHRLESLRGIRGAQCKEYVAFRGAVEGAHTYRRAAAGQP
jgi:hypothetical protein